MGSMKPVFLSSSCKKLRHIGKAGIPDFCSIKRFSQKTIYQAVSCATRLIFPENRHSNTCSLKKHTSILSNKDSGAESTCHRTTHERNRAILTPVLYPPRTGKSIIYPAGKKTASCYQPISKTDTLVNSKNCLVCYFPNFFDRAGKKKPA